MDLLGASRIDIGRKEGGREGVAYGCGPEAFACARAVEGTPATAARVAVQSATCMKTWLCLPWQLAGTTPPARIAGVRYITAHPKLSNRDPGLQIIHT